MIEQLKDNILVEKYRPSKLDDMVLEPELNTLLHDILTKARNSNPVGLPHFILEGRPGCGKTSAAVMLPNELGLEYLFLNVGSDLNIDAIKNSITTFASTMSVYDFDSNGNAIHKKKIVVLDEIDSLAKQSNVLKTLKSFIEMYSGNCTFIFTCNNYESISNDKEVKDAIKSRCHYINFNVKDRAKHQGRIFKRLCYICEQEQYKYEKQNLVDIIKHFVMDMRSMINFIDLHYSELDKPNLVYLLTTGMVDKLFENIRNKDFVSIRKFLNETDINFSSLFYEVYCYAKDYVEKPEMNVPLAIMITENFMDKYSRSINPEITMTAYLIELATRIAWKKI